MPLGRHVEAERGDGILHVGGEMHDADAVEIDMNALSDVTNARGRMNGGCLSGR